MTYCDLHIHNNILHYAYAVKRIARSSGVHDLLLPDILRIAVSV